MIDLAKANRQMVAERLSLLAERDRIAQELTQRCVDDATAVIKGLGALVDLARAGNPGAKLALATLAAHLEAVAGLQSRITVVRNGGQSEG